MTVTKHKRWLIDINSRELPSVDYYGPPPWRSYELNTYGDNERQLIENVGISEIDQDGGELTTYGLIDAKKEVQEEVKAIIKEALCEAGITSESEQLSKTGS